MGNRAAVQESISNNILSKLFQINNDVKEYEWNIKHRLGQYCHLFIACRIISTFDGISES